MNPKPVSSPWFALSLLLGINLFNYLDRYVLAAVEPLISKDLFPNDTDAKGKVGLLATAFLLSYMLLAPLFGWLADRLSRWHLIAFGVAIWSLASGASGLATTFTLLLITRVFVGIGEAAYGPAAPTIIADLFPIAKRGKVLSWFYVAIPVGSAIGYAFGGYIGEHYGWSMPFYLVTIPGLLLAILCLPMKDPRIALQKASLAPPKKSIRLQDVLALFKIPSYAYNTAAMAAMTFAIGGISFWLPSYLFTYRAADFGTTPSLGQINLTFGAITVLAGLTATLLGGWLGDRLRPRFPSAYFLVSGIAIGLSFPCILAILYCPFPTAWIFVFLAVFFLFFNTGPSNTALANVSPPAIRSTAFAINILVIHLLGDAISPPLIGWIADRSDMNKAFLVVAATTLLASLLWLLGARFLGRDTETIARLENPLPSPTTPSQG